jgi:hypothetical protein
MYLMYVDESGDAGLVNSPTRYFVLTGIVVHELRWREWLDAMIAYRSRMRSAFGLLMREEIHAGRMLTRPGNLVKIRRNDRLTILRHFLDEMSQLGYLNIINVVVDKQGKPQTYDPFERAWQALIQRFENTINHNNFNGPRNADDRGIIFCDETDEAALRRIIRKMGVYNPIPNQFGIGYRLLPLNHVIEDPSLRKSHQSYLIQAADVAAFSLYQYYNPSSYIRKKGAKNYFLRLDLILCKVASPRNPFGIVEL